jgi:hypothetical protein
MYQIPTPEEIDSTLASLSDDDLMALVDAQGQVPRVEWVRMTAQERRAMRARNLLARRAVAAEKRAADAATRAASKVERCCSPACSSAPSSSARRTRSSWKRSAANTAAAGEMPSLSRPDLAPRTSPE